MGRTIATCFQRVGANGAWAEEGRGGEEAARLEAAAVRAGATMVEDGQTLTDEIDFTEGMEIDRGFVSPYFVKNQASRGARWQPFATPSLTHLGLFRRAGDAAV